MGRAVGQSGACVRGYMWVNQLTASLSSPFSRGSTTCRGVPAHAHTCFHITKHPCAKNKPMVLSTQAAFCNKAATRQLPPTCACFPSGRLELHATLEATRVHTHLLASKHMNLHSARYTLLLSTPALLSGKHGAGQCAPGGKRAQRLCPCTRAFHADVASGSMCRPEPLLPGPITSHLQSTNLSTQQSSLHLCLQVDNSVCSSLFVHTSPQAYKPQQYEHYSSRWRGFAARMQPACSHQELSMPCTCSVKACTTMLPSKG